MIRTLLSAGMAMLAVPVAAQTSWSTQASAPSSYDIEGDDDRGRDEAGALESRPGVIAANRAALARTARGGAVLAADQARYAADIAAYRAAMRAHRRDVAVGARQERAYAMAMVDWRAQVDACDRGQRQACVAPAPDPADYW